MFAPLKGVGVDVLSCEVLSLGVSVVRCKYVCLTGNCLCTLEGVGKR